MTNIIVGRQHSIAKRHDSQNSATTLYSCQSSWMQCLPEKTGLPRFRHPRIQSLAAPAHLLHLKVLERQGLLLAMYQAAVHLLLSLLKEHRIYLQIKRAATKLILHLSAKKTQIAPWIFHLPRAVATPALAARQRPVNTHLLHCLQRRLPR